MAPRPAVIDGVIIGTGAVLLVAGFLPWWQAEVTAGGVALTPARGHTAWDVSAAWWLPVLAGTAAGGLWLLRRNRRLALPWLPAVTVLVGVVGLGLVLGRWVTLPAGGTGDYGWYAYAPVADAAPASRGTPGLGLWLAGAALAVQAAAALLATHRAGPSAAGGP